MSTNTTFKRIALVAVAALGFGLLSVVPSNAANVTTTAVATDSADASGAIRTAVTFTETLTVSGSVTAGEAFVLTPVMTGTAKSAYGTSVSVKPAKLIPTATVLTNLTASAPDSTTGVVTYTTVAATVETTAVVTYTFTPDTWGTYIFTFTPSGALTTNTAAAYTFTATAAASATVVPSGGLTNVAGTAATATAIGDGSRFVKMDVFAGTSDKAYIVSSTGTGALYGTVASTTSATEVTDYTNGTNAVGGFGIGADTSVQGATVAFVSGDTFSVYALSSAAGTQTITVTPTNGTTASRTLTITWGAAPTVSAQYSTSFIGAAADATVDDATRVYSATAGTKRATVTVQLNSAAATAITGQSIAASISGPGTLELSTSSTATTAAGRSLSVTGAVGSASKYYVHVYSDGTAGASTITITSGTTAISTETVTFVGTQAKVIVTQKLFVTKTGTQLGGNPDATALLNDLTTVAKTPAFYVDVTDAGDNPVVAGSTLKMVSSNTAVANGGVCVEYTDYPGSFECSVIGASGALSGQTATITVQVLNPLTAAYDIVATPMTFAVGGSIATTTVSLDSSSYAPGQAMALSVVAVDSSGNKAYDGQAPYISLSSNKGVGGALPAATKQIKDGKYVTSLTLPSLYAPALGGAFIISGLTAATVAAPAGAAFTVTATVEDASLSAATDAAAEATDAANAATDAANAAAEAADAATAAAQDAADAVAALSAQVATLISGLKAQLTALTNLVIKIQKKVKA
jgi:hypothetical protein